MIRIFGLMVQVVMLILFTDAADAEVDDSDDDGGCKSLGGRAWSRQVRRIFLLRHKKRGDPPVITGTLAASYLILLSRFLQSHL